MMIRQRVTKKSSFLFQKFGGLMSFYSRQNGYYLSHRRSGNAVAEGHRVGNRVKKLLLEEQDVHNVLVQINPYFNFIQEKSLIFHSVVGENPAE